jgi:transposase
MREKLRFLGLDVHAETIAVAIAKPDGEVRSLGTIPNRTESIRKLIKKLGPGEKLRACYEAGPTGYVVYWQLAKLGIPCEVVAPTLVPVKAGDRVKTDRCDAEKLARCCRSGDLTAVWVPDEGSEALRDLVRTREAAKQDQMWARHRLSKFLLRSGQRPPSGVRPWTRPYLIWVAQLRFTQMAREATRLDYLHEVEHMRERVARLEQAITEAVKLASPALQSCQRSAGTEGYRRDLGSNHHSRIGPGIPLWQCSATDGLLRCCAERRLQWKANETREHH